MSVLGCRYDFSPTPLLSSNTMQLTLCCPSIRKQQQQKLSVSSLRYCRRARVMLVSGDYVGLYGSSHSPPNQPRTRPARPPKLQARTFSLKLTTLQLYYIVYTCTYICTTYSTSSTTQLHLVQIGSNHLNNRDRYVFFYAK